MGILDVLIGERAGIEDAKPSILELLQGGVVPLVGQRHSRSHRQQVASGRPLLAFLIAAARPPAPHRLQRQVHLAQGREEVFPLAHAVLPLSAVQHRQSLGSDEVPG